jgi:hypothetical protein
VTPTRPRPARPGFVGPNDPTKWLCRKRNDWWWIWKPKDYIPCVQLRSFEEARAWRPPKGAYV